MVDNNTCDFGDYIYDDLFGYVLKKSSENINNIMKNEQINSVINTDNKLYIKFKQLHPELNDEYIYSYIFSMMYMLIVV
jgi:hypothetical protein